MKKIIAKLGCFFIHNGFNKAKFLKKASIFGSFGENCFWHPRILPSEAEKVFIGNNVAVATDVYFCTHDINHIVLNNCDFLKKSGGGGTSGKQETLLSKITSLLALMHKLNMA